MENKNKYCGSKELAELFSLTQRRVQQLTKDGTIDTVKVGRSNLYHKDETITAYVRHLQEAVAQVKEESDIAANLREQKIKAEITLKESQAELHRMKVQVASGKLIDIKDVKLDYDAFFPVFKRFAFNLARRIAVKVSEFTDAEKAAAIERELKQELHKQLRGFKVCGIGHEK